MTRSQKIALALHARQTPSDPLAQFNLYYRTPSVCYYASHGCYEAMDDPEPYQDVNPSDRIADAPQVITGGNFGMPCA